MFGISEKALELLRKEYPVGCRVELVRMNDQYQKKPAPGDRGTVKSVDDIGTIHVSWDCGSSLGVAYGEDSCRRLKTVTTVCYGTEKVWDSRSEAEAYFLEAMACCDGAEKERYTNIYLDLKCGYDICKDTED